MTMPLLAVAGHVAHQFMTAVRRPASAATSQTVFARRSSRLAIDGRVSRTRSVAVRTMRADGARLGADRALHAGDAPRLDAWTPCTSAGTPVAIVVHARAGSDVSCGSKSAPMPPPAGTVGGPRGCCVGLVVEAVDGDEPHAVSGGHDRQRLVIRTAR